MSDESLNINKKLRDGIEAARSGQKHMAQTHLHAVLKADPHNTAAMLWLAFVSPPQESLHLLERVLELDPANERAKSGLRWAKERLTQGPVAPEKAVTRPVPTAPQPPPQADTQPHPAPTPPVETQPRSAPPETQPTPPQPTVPPSGVEALRKKLISNESQESAKKGVLAHRARRTIDPLVTLLIIFSTLALLALGLVGVLIFGPTETVAAWLPVNTPTRPAVAPIFVPAPPLTPTLNHLPTASALSAEKKTPPATAIPVVSNRPTPPSPALLLGPTPRPIPVPLAPTPTLAPTAPVLVVPTPTPTVKLLLAHQPAYPGEKWIEVNLTTQQLTAWEGDQPVYAFTVSTGLPGTPTVLGEYRIYWKLTSTLMIGPNYYLPGVPYTMYFYRGYALHGTYWHHNFGQPMSHGCVNLETSNAQTLFDWAGPTLPAGQTEVTASDTNPGTLVVVHE